MINPPPVLKQLLEEIENTQVVIMAGGQGKRMGLNKPKPLIEINGKTFIDRCIEYYQANGYKNIIVLLGYKAEQVEEHVRKTHSEVKIGKDPDIKYVGKAKALKHALQTGTVDKNKRIIIAFPDDIFLDPHLPTKLLMHHLQGLKLYQIWATAVFAQPANYPYGKARISQEGIVEEFIEKPKVNIATSTGIYLFEPPVYEIILETDLNTPKPIEFEEEIVPRLAKNHKLYALTIPGDLWIPINTQKDLEKAEILLKTQRYTFL